MSRSSLLLLRVLGWKYSPDRGAFVHRLGGNRWGPVFRVDGRSGDRMITVDPRALLADAPAAPWDPVAPDAADVTPAEAAAPPLPRRTPRRPPAAAQHDDPAPPGSAAPSGPPLPRRTGEHRQLATPMLPAAPPRDEARPEDARVDGRPPRRNDPPSAVHHAS